MNATIDRADAKRLAVAYQAFSEATEAKRDNGIRVWGRMLLDMQGITGIEMHDPDLIKGYVRRAGGEV